MNYNPQKFFILLNLFFLTLTCKSDKVLYRATSDYFPLKPKMVWKYTKDNDTSVVEVIGDTWVFGHYASLVYRDFVEEFWLKDKTEIKKLVEKKLNRAGYDYVLEQQFRCYFSLPLIIGNVWHEDYIATVDVLGSQIDIKHTINGKIVSIENITTPAGTFTEVYNITLIDSLQLNDSLLIETHHYWLAPEVGIIKYAAPDTFELIQFTTQNP